MPGRRAQQVRIGREAVLRFRHANRVRAVVTLQLRELVPHLLVRDDFVGAVDLANDTLVLENREVSIDGAE